MTDQLSDYTDEEREAFSALPRSADLDHAMEDRVVAALRTAGLLRSRRSRFTSLAAFAIAAGLIVAAWFGGIRYGTAIARAASIEGQLERTDLSSTDRILLMPRAGSAYVAAANGYASSVKQADATAVEVSSQVLMSAAQAVARTSLDGALTPRLAAAFGRPNTSNAFIWY